jgi:predicted dehydrogenase
MRIDAMGGHITLDTEAALRVKPLGQPGYDVSYPHRNVNFGGDCVYALQRHFVDAMTSGAEFEANGDDYLKTLAVVDAVYESTRLGEVVRL